MRSPGHYEEFAALFDYPDETYLARVRAAQDSVTDSSPAAAARLDAFASALAPVDLASLEEAFTRTFDVQAVTTLSLGYLIFGDDYKRGELLANLNRELGDAGIDCGSELPDHLPTVLRLIARWRDEALVAELVEEIVRPAVRKMVAEFEPARMEQHRSLYARHFGTLIASSARHATLFQEPLAALATVLDDDFPIAHRVAAPRQSDFLQFIGRELEIETTQGRPGQPEQTT